MIMGNDPEMADSALVVTLPLPPKALSPNARGHWAKKHRAAQQYRGDAKLACQHAINREGVCVPWNGAFVRPTYFHAVRRRRDRDNHLAMLKAAFDGVVDAGLLENDSALVPLPPVFRVDRDDPRVVLEFHCGSSLRRRLGQ